MVPDRPSPRKKTWLSLTPSPRPSSSKLWISFQPALWSSALNKCIKNIIFHCILRYVIWSDVYLFTHIIITETDTELRYIIPYTSKYVSAETYAFAGYRLFAANGLPLFTYIESRDSNFIRVKGCPRIAHPPGNGKRSPVLWSLLIDQKRSPVQHHASHALPYPE
jgi:hypothetical protein